MGFFDIPDWMSRLAENELRIQKELAKITELTRLQDQAARMFEAERSMTQKFADEIKKLALFESPVDKMDKMNKDAWRSFEQLCTSLGRPSDLSGIWGSQYDPWSPALQPEHFKYGADRLQDAIVEAVERALAKRDPKPLERDPTLYGADGVRRQPGFKAPTDDEDDKK